MNKTQQIKDQGKVIENLSDDLARLRLRLDAEAKLVTDLVDQCDQADARTTALRDKHAAEKKAAEEAATLKSIRDGFVPIEVLRHLVREEYKTTHNASSVKTDLTVMLDGARPVDKAILDALLVKPVKLTYTLTPQALSDFTAQAARGLAPKFASGGYTIPKVGDRVGVYYCGNN